MGDRLVAVDVDGTLLRSDHCVSGRTRRTLEAVTRMGHVIVLASSRSPRGLEPVLAQCAGSASWAIACQGAVVTAAPALDRDQAMIDSTLHGPTALSVADRAAHHGGSVCWHVWDRLLVRELTDAVHREVAITGEQPELQTHGFHDSPPPHKILAMFDDHTRTTRFLEYCREHQPCVHAVLSKPGYVEITRRGTDKGEALLHLAAVLGVTRSDVIAIGDGENDVGLLRAAGTAVAMGNASAPVFEVANHVTATNDRDGVASALEALVGPLLS